VPLLRFEYLPLPLVVEGSPAEGFEEEEDESNDPMESLPPIKANARSRCRL